MTKGWRGEPTRHGLASRGIPTKVKNHHSVAVDQDEIADTFWYEGNPVAIVDIWNFGGMWDKKSDLIMIDYDTFSRFSSEHRDFILKHEIVERDLAKEDEEFEQLSQADLVRRYHEKANEMIVDDFSEEELKNMWKNSYDVARQQSPDCSERETIEAVDWHMKGTGISSEDFDVGDIT